MKYFLHDTNAFNDEKITELYMKFGYEGLGLFYTVLEKIAFQEKPVKTDVLKSQLNVGKRLERCWNFMEEIGIISSSNGETFNKQLLNFSEKYKIKKEKNRERILQWRENNVDTKNVTRYEHVRNTPKVKRSKVNRIEVKEREVKEKENKEKESPHVKKHSFRNSLYFSKEKFQEVFNSSEQPYCNANTDHYYDAALNGSDAKGYMYLDWIAAIKNWMRKDIQAEKFISKFPELNKKNGSTSTNFKPKHQQVADHNADQLRRIMDGSL